MKTITLPLNDGLSVAVSHDKTKDVVTSDALDTVVIDQGENKVLIPRENVPEFIKTLEEIYG